MLRLLLIAIAGVLLARLLGWVPPWLKRQQSSGTGKSIPTLVRCHRCGLSVPKEEAYAHKDLWYCSLEHLNEDAS